MYSRMTLSQAAKTRYYKKNIINSTKDNIAVIFFGVMYLIGVFIGVQVILHSAGQFENGIFAIFSNFIEVRASQPIQETVISSFLSTFYLVAILFLLGFCAISTPIIPFIPLFKGIGYGISISAVLQSDYRGELVKMLLLLMPYTISTAVIIIVGSKYASGLSSMCYRIFKDGKGSGGVSVKEYCQNFVVLIILTGLFSLIDAVLYSLIAPTLLV